MSNANAFARTIPFLVERHGWGGHKKASLAHVTIGAPPEEPEAHAAWNAQQARVKAAVSLNKRLVNSDAIRAITGHDAAFRAFLNLEAATPFRPGLYLVALGMVDIVNNRAIQWETQREVLADAAAREYPSLITAAPERLGPLFNPSDYPPVERFRSSFWVSWRFIDMGVPNLLREIRADVFEREADKMRREAERATVMIQQHLRASLLDITNHLASLLAPRAGGKKPGLRAGTLDGLQQFLATLAQRDVSGDESLRAVARRLLNVSRGVGVDQLKDDDELRARMAATMATATTELEALVEDLPDRRAIHLRDEEFA